MTQRNNSASRVWIGLLVAGAAWLGFAQAAPAQTDGDILHTDKRLLTEERVQLDARNRITAAVLRINFLLEDLVANGLVTEGGGQKIQKMNILLASVGNNNVPRAVTLLRTARLDLKQALLHLKGAEQEIRLIIVELDRVLEGASSLLADDRLLKELSELIKTEDFLKRQTTTWGQRLIIAPDTAKLDQGRLGRAQQSALERYEGFFKLLTDATAQADAESKKRFGAAEKVLRNGKPDILLSEAIDQILSAKAVGAVRNQGEALKLLLEAQKILAADQSGLAELLKDLKEIIAEQKKLKSEVEKTNGEQFSKGKSQFEAGQLGITKDIAAWVNVESLQGGPLEAPLREAHRASGQANVSLAAAEKSKAIQAKTEVIAALEQALKIALEELAKEKEQAKIDVDLAGLGDLSGLEGNPSEGKGDAPGTPGGSPGTLGAGMGQGKGTGMGKGKAPGKGQPTPFTGDPKDLAEDFADGTSSTVAKGDKVARTQGAVDAISRRERSAAIQRYVQQLPPEFRRQVAAYYEALAE